MASATSPSGIVYPDASDPIAPLNTVFKDLADSVEAALTGPSGATGGFEQTFMMMGA
jgi:hypothetical protein